jgi:hypothetical protein
VSGKPYSWVEDATPVIRRTRRYTHHEPVLYPRFPDTEVPVPAEDTPCVKTPEAWFPTREQPTTAEAKRICSHCWMRPECLAYGMAHPELEGVWGGRSQRERQPYKTPSRRGR